MVLYGNILPVSEVKAWFSRRRIEDPIRYDPKRGEYFEKVVPTEVLAWWIWVIVGLLMAFTGLALIYPNTLAFVHKICGAVIADYGETSGAAVRAAHLMGAVLVIVVGIVHAYASWVYKMIRSVITGERNEPIVEE